jgi:FkbM family methyltransferase
MGLRQSVVSQVMHRPRVRRLLTRMVAGDRDMQVNICGTKLQINSAKEHGYLRVQRLLQWSTSFTLQHEINVLLNMCLLLEDGDTFVDVGANVGLYACTLARRLKLRPGKNRVYAFEPNPDTFGRLKLSADALGIEAVMCAVSDHAGTLEFVSGAVSNVFTSVDRANHFHLLDEKQSVPCRRLDEIEMEGEKFVLKIDVEGQELSVLKGATKLFDANRVKAVYIDGYEDPGIEEFLRARGMRLFDGLTLLPLEGKGNYLLALKDA